MKLLFAALTLVTLFLASCHPDNPNDPQPVNPTPVDTLSAGWTRVTQVPFYNYLQGYVDVYFTNNSTGYLLGNDTLYKSTDGGRNWSVVQTFVRGSGLAELGVGNDQNIAIAHRDDTLYVSKNGGAGFNKVPTGVVSPRGIFYTSPTEIFASGREILRSQNGGDTWQLMYTKPGAAGMYSNLFFLNSNTGWDIAESGLYQTTNGGVTWTKNAAFTFTTPGAPAIVQFVDAANGFVSTTNGLYKTSNGGTSWTKIVAADALRAGVTVGYPDIHFFNASSGYYIGAHAVYRTDDGGNSWTREVRPYITSADMIELHFTDANHGWACGMNGLLYRYER